MSQNILRLTTALIFTIATVPALAATTPTTSSGVGTAGPATVGAGSSNGPGSANGLPNGLRNGTPGVGNTSGAAVNPATAGQPDMPPAGTTGVTPVTQNPNMPNNGKANWSAENQYWQSHFSSRPYHTGTTGYTSYQPAYQYGVTLFNENGGKPFTTIDQSQLQAGWAKAHGMSPLSWTQAQAATRDAYDRLYQNRNDLSGTASPATP